MTWYYIAIECFFAAVGIFSIWSIQRDIRNIIRFLKDKDKDKE
jgi:presenilin-like A22 family membrane protease